MSHICFLLGVLGFASICALILSERWQGLSRVKVEIAAIIAALSGLAHSVAAGLDNENFALSWLFAGVGLILAAGWHVLAGRLPEAKPRSNPNPTQQSLAAASTALAFASALAVYMTHLV